MEREPYRAPLPPQPVLKHWSSVERNRATWCRTISGRPSRTSRPTGSDCLCGFPRAWHWGHGLRKGRRGNRASCAIRAAARSWRTCGD